MKAGFAMSNPMVTRVNSYFIPEIFGEIVPEEERLVAGIEEGEVIGGVHVTVDAMVIDEPEAHVDPVTTE